MSNFDIIQVLFIFSLVGLLIGLSGIGGFLIPIYLINIVKMDLEETLIYTFIAFLLSGMMGFISYYRAKVVPKELILKTVVPIMIGSIIGVMLSESLNEEVIKTLLYLIALSSGLFMMRQINKQVEHPILKKTWFWTAIGFIVGLVCSIAGVGGALILVPVLTLLGFPMRSSVGLGILASIFVSLPASIGYSLQASAFTFQPIMYLGFILHVLFVIVGFKLSHHIKQKALKLTIGLITVVSSIYLLGQLFV